LFCARQHRFERDFARVLTEALLDQIYCPLEIATLVRGTSFAQNLVDVLGLSLQLKLFLSVGQKRLNLLLLRKFGEQAVEYGDRVGPFFLRQRLPNSGKLLKQLLSSLLLDDNQSDFGDKLLHSRCGWIADLEIRQKDFGV